MCGGESTAVSAARKARCFARRAADALILGAEAGAAEDAAASEATSAAGEGGVGGGSVATGGVVGEEGGGTTGGEGLLSAPAFLLPLFFVMVVVDGSDELMISSRGQRSLHTVRLVVHNTAGRRAETANKSKDNGPDE